MTKPKLTFSNMDKNHECFAFLGNEPVGRISWVQAGFYHVSIIESSHHNGGTLVSCSDFGQAKATVAEFVQ